MAIDSVDGLLRTLHAWKTSNDQNPEERQLYEKFNSIYEVSQDIGRLVIPSLEMETKVFGWLANAPNALEDVASQSVIIIRNKVIEEETIFNALREKRLRSSTNASQRAFVDQIAEESRKTCDFCEYQQRTAEDSPFGRIETEHAFTAANVFKVDAWNSLVIFRNHHPLDWTDEEFNDALLNTANDWFKRVHGSYPAYRFPFIVWDLLPNGGASQIHTHFHVMLTKNRYHGGLECWRQRSLRYAEDYKRNYFNDLIELHDSLGLSVRLGSAVAMASLTPKRDNEVVLVCLKNDLDFYRILYRVIRAFISDFAKFGFSLAVALPPLDESVEQGLRMTRFARIVTRGDVNDIRSDIGSLDLFTAPSISTDPFATARLLKQHCERYSTDEH